MRARARKGAALTRKKKIMPRIDKSFSDSDVLRIIQTHLTRKEQRSVFFAILFIQGVSDSIKNLFVILIDLAADFVPFPGVRIIARVIKRILGVGGAIDSAEVIAEGEKALKKAKITVKSFQGTFDRAIGGR
jgi:hypothetical protein